MHDIRFVSLLLALAVLVRPAHASDHLDTNAVIADPAADIGDLYAWMSPDQRRLNLAMTIVGRKFSDHVRYTFHVDSGHTLGHSTASTTLDCDFDVAVAPDCRLGDERARGDASLEAGVYSDQRRFRVFAGLRDDPFFNNVRGTRAALNIAATALNAGVSRDVAGCPRFDAATIARIRDEWRHTDGHAGSNFLAGWQTAALVIEVDVSAMNRGGPLLAVWATTTVRAAPPGHPPLEAGLVIDRMGRALTGNALIGPFDDEAASDARKSQYNRAPREAWPMFAPDLAETLAVYDAFDGQCANQWLAQRRAGPARYVRLAMLLADDRIWIDSRRGTCELPFAVELTPTAPRDCGGRTPDYDAVDVFRSLLTMGRTSGLDDGVSRDDREHPTRVFPFLAPP